MRKRPSLGAISFTVFCIACSGGGSSHRLGGNDESHAYTPTAGTGDAGENTAAAGQNSTIFAMGGAGSPIASGGASGYAGIAAPQTAGKPAVAPGEYPIDDLEDGSGRIFARDGRVGVWYSFNSHEGSQWPAPTTPGIPIETSLIPGGRATSTRGIHTFGSFGAGSYSDWAGVGFDLAFDGKNYRTYDARSYDGISFWARGSAPSSLQIRVSIRETTIPDYGGSCVVDDYYYCEPHDAAWSPGSDWHKHWVPFEHFQQSGNGAYRHFDFDTSVATNVQFYCPVGCTAFDFWIDDVAFYKGVPSCCWDPPASCRGQVSLDGTLLGRALGKTTLSSCEVCTQSGLTLSSTSTDTTDLTGLGCYTGLHFLTISGARLSDLSPLQELQTLESLTLKSVGLTDARPLRALPLLLSLDLSSNQITDSAGLSGEWKLHSLNLSNNQLTEVAQLSSMPALKALRIESNQLKEVGGLASLTNLEELDLSNNALADLKPLAGLTALTSLDLSSNAISDLSPLAALVSLTSLDLSNNSIVDLSPLANLRQLRTLKLDGNRVQSTLPLIGMSELKIITLADNALTDLRGFSGMTKLNRAVLLDLSDNSIADLRPLANLELWSIDLSRNRIIDAAGLPSSLLSLTLDENGIIDVPDLSALANLTTLRINHNLIGDLTPLASVPRLSELYAAGNRIASLLPIAAAFRLHILDFTDNQIGDLSPIVMLPGLDPLPTYMATSYGRVLVTQNPIDCAEQATQISSLEGRDVTVAVDCP